jgi:hypothetical protein
VIRQTGQAGWLRSEHADRQAGYSCYLRVGLPSVTGMPLTQADGQQADKQAGAQGRRANGQAGSQPGRQADRRARMRASSQADRLASGRPLTYRVLSITHYETWAGRRPLPLPWLLLVHVLLLLPLPPLLQVLLLLPLPPSLLSTATAPSAATGTTAATAVATATALSGRCLPSPSRCSAQCSLVRACSRC